jgi:rfaE bifunctional protein nucleotidyltransferase chain/domain
MRDPKHKIISLAEAVSWRATLRAAGGTLAVRNGCFDLKHSGHDESLYRASREADVLLVLLNSDESVRRLKGAGRPLFPQDDRAYSLACHAGVAKVVIFDGDTCAPELAALRPDTYVTSDEYRESQNPAEAAALAACGAQVVWLPRVPGRSTTAVVAKLQRGEAA